MKKKISTTFFSYLTEAENHQKIIYFTILTKKISKNSYLTKARAGRVPQRPRLQVLVHETLLLKSVKGETVSRGALGTRQAVQVVWNNEQFIATEQNKNTQQNETGTKK